MDNQPGLANMIQIDENKPMLNEDDNNDAMQTDQQTTDSVDGTDGFMEITDEEFLEIWKHPLENYSHGRMGASKHKHEKKARVLRKIEKRTSKQNRKFRHDSENFQFGSNAIITSSVPYISTKHTPVKL